MTEYVINIGDEVAGRVDTLVDVYKILKLVQNACLYHTVTPLIKLMKFKNSEELVFTSCFLLFEIENKLYIRCMKVVKHDSSKTEIL